MKTFTIVNCNLKTVVTAILFTLIISAFPRFVLSQTMTRSDRLFIQKGIFFGAWTKTDGADEDYVMPRTTVVPINSSGRYVRIQLPHTDPLSLAEVEIFSGGTNVAIGQSTQQSSDFNGSQGFSNLAVDGNTDGKFANGSVTQTAPGNVAMEPWWQVDLDDTVTIDSIRIWHRTDSFPERNKGFYLFVSNTPFSSGTLLGTMAQTGNRWYTQPGIIHYPTGSELTDIGFIPMYYGRPQYNYHIHLQNPASQWSMAAAPFQFSINTAVDRLRAPSAFEKSNGFLNSLQLADVDNLASVCIGEEEQYSDAVVNNVKAWFDIARSKYPNVLLHNNQPMFPWSADQLQTYTKVAQPDILTADNYYFYGNYSPTGWADYSYIMSQFQKYRFTGLGGADGSGNSPVNYGAYLEGFVNVSGTRIYYPSESELNLETYSYLVMGAKWITIFRYIGIYDPGFFIRPDGSRTPQYWQFAKIIAETRNLSPHLSRLRSTDLRIIPGRHLVNGTATGNPTYGIPTWNSLVDPYITGITVTNLQSITNSGLQGDLAVGYFKPVVGLDNTSGITMAPVTGMNTQYFMLMNGLVRTNGCCNGPGTSGILQDTIQGKANLARQSIVLNIDFKNNPVDTLFRVRRGDGVVEMVNLKPLGGTKYSYTDTLDGGKGDLFFWARAGSINAGSIQNGTYNLISDVNDASVLDVREGKTADTTPVWLYHPNGSAAQQWVVTSLGNGYYKLQPVNAPGKALDVRGAGSTNGTQLQIYTDNGTNAQRWQITPLGNGFYNLSPACAPASNMDVSGGSTTDGAKVQLWSKNVTGAQKWRFAPVTAPVSKIATTPASVVLKQSTDFAVSSGAKLYPNPVATGVLKMDITSLAAAGSVISIFDMSGKMVYSEMRQLAKGLNHTEINVSTLPAGIYLLQIKQRGETEQYKFVKE